MNETLIFTQVIQNLKATDVVRNEQVRNQFINVYDMIWKQGGEAAYERESINFNKQLRDNDKLRRCTALSVFLAFIDLAVRGLSLEPGAQALCYLLPRNYKAGTDASGKDIWESRCNLTISAYGELVLRVKAGQISHADNPVIVYEGDAFSYGEQDGSKYVNYRCNLPRTSDRIVACFMKITRCDGTVDYAVMLPNDWQRLAAYSAKNNSYYDAQTRQRVEKANDLYNVNGQIDPGFLIAKCIKHAFKSYPKISIGKGTQLESEILDDQNQDFDPYAGAADTQPQEEPQQDSFTPQADPTEGVTIDTANTADDGTF